MIEIKETKNISKDSVIQIYKANNECWVDKLYNAINAII